MKKKRILLFFLADFQARLGHAGFGAKSDA